MASSSTSGVAAGPSGTVGSAWWTRSKVSFSAEERKKTFVQRLEGHTQGAYTVVSWAKMWEGVSPPPREELVFGPKYPPTLDCVAVAAKVVELGLPAAWGYAGNSKLSTVGNCPPGWVGVHVHAFKWGLRFPLDAWVAELLAKYQLPLRRLSPAFWAHVAVFNGVCKQLGVVPSAAVFHAVYKMAARTNALVLDRRNPEVGFCHGSPKLDKAWMHHHFYFRPVADVGSLPREDAEKVAWFWGERSPPLSWSPGNKELFNQEPQLTEEEAATLKMFGQFDYNLADKDFLETFEDFVGPRGSLYR